MAKIKGTVVCFFISFLASSWPSETLGAPSCNPLLVQRYYPGDGSAFQRQQLLNQARSLLDQLSSPTLDCPVNVPRVIAASAYDTPSNSALENVETSLLLNLVNRLNALKSNSIIAADPTSRLPVIPAATSNSIANQYENLKVLIATVPSKDVGSVQSALDALYNTFVKIVTGQLANAELPNLCSKTLALNTQLKSINAPAKVQDAVNDFIKSLTLALTGQSQLSISAVCESLNDLESSVVTVVENDAPRKVQHLLSNLVGAVTDAVVSGGDVGCNVIDVVRRYVSSINQAVQQDAGVRSGKIYSSVLSFEEELYKVLINSDPTAVAVPALDPNTISSNPKTEEDYITEIGLLSKAIFGDRANLVRPGVETLLELEKSRDLSPRDQPTSSDISNSELDSLRKVDDLLKFVIEHPKTDTTHVLEMLVDLLGLLPSSDIPAVLDALDPVSLPESGSPGGQDETTSALDDAAAIVSKGELFIVKEVLVPVTDDNGNVVEILRSGIFQLVDPSTNDVWSGSFAVQGGNIQPTQDGGVDVESSGVYDVDLPSSDSATVKRQADFAVAYRTVVQVDEKGNTQTVENGRYSLTNPVTGNRKSGDFNVVNTVSKSNPDGSMEVTRSGVLSVDEPDATSTDEQPSLDGDGTYFLLSEHVSGNPNGAGESGSGICNFKQLGTGVSESATYEILNLFSTTNSDGSTDSRASGVFHVDGVDLDAVTDNSDPSLILMNGAEFTSTFHKANVTDLDGQVRVVHTGRFIETDPETGITKSVRLNLQNAITIENLDGSTDYTVFGQINSVKTTLPSTNPFGTTTSSSDSTKTSTTDSATPLTVTKDSLQAFLNSFNSQSVKAVQPAVVSPGTETLTTGDSSTYDATSILSDGTSYIVNELVTPILDAEGNVIDQIIMGTYHFQNVLTNSSWSGSYEGKDSSTKILSPGVTEVTKSGQLMVAPNADCSPSTIEAQFLIDEIQSSVIDENGIQKASARGTYSVTDSNTGASKSGNFIRENSLSTTRPGGATEITRSGLLFVDDSDASSPSTETNLPNYDAYLLFDDRILDAPDINGNYGTGRYSITAPTTETSTTGTYLINKASTETNPDGTVVSKIEGVIHSDSDTDSSSPTSIVIDGAEFSLVDNVAYVTDSYGHVSLFGSGTLTQTDPETGAITSQSYDILNIAPIPNRDGSKNVRRFGGVFNNDNGDDSHLTTSNTASTSNANNPAELLASNSNAISALLDSYKLVPLSSQGSTLTSQSVTPKIRPATVQTTTIHQVPVSANPTDDPTTIVTDGTSFLIYETLVPQLDDAGNIVNLLKSGEFNLIDPNTQKSSTGSFFVDNSSVSSPIQGQINTVESGTFAVNGPNDGSGTANPGKKLNYSLQENVNIVVDDNGISRATDEGTYSLTNPITGTSVGGDFFVDNVVSKSNPDGSIEVTKSGTLYVNKVCTTSPGKKPVPISDGGDFLFTNRIFATPDAEGNRGVGFYSIKDPKNNEHTTGTYLIKNLSTKTNPDGTVDSKTSGSIFVDSARSSTTSVNPDPTLAIIDGAKFTFVDHLTSVTDPNGNVHPVGTGVFTQTDPKTGATRTGRYRIQNYLTVDNPDGSHNVVESGTFLYTSDSGAATGSSASPDSETNSTPTLAELKTSLKALIDSVNALTQSEVSSTLPASNSPSAAVSAPRLIAASVELPLSDVVSAVDGQSLSPEDLVVVQGESGNVLVATIKDSTDSVCFTPTNLADLTGKIVGATSVWTVPTSRFSEEDSSLLENLLNAENPPCDRRY